MGTLASRSALILALLFGLVFAVGTDVAYYYDLPLTFAVLFAVVVVFLQYLTGPWIIGMLFSIQWIAPDNLGPEFATWYRKTCVERDIREPSLGIIHDGNPNAFTYGHTPRNARIVVTTGLIEMLDREETNAVIAHELGHVKNYDFIVMTIAQLAPLILYIIYRWSRRVRGNRSAAAAAGVAVGAYLAYLVAQYLVLFLSRVREYFADEASALTTRHPDKLSSALVKIAYGLALRPVAAEGSETVGDQGRYRKGGAPMFGAGRATAALGICSAAAASGFAMTAADAEGKFSPTVMAEAMQWDIKNPWGTWYELNSTHPLTARRVLALSRISHRLGLPVDTSLEPSGVHRVYSGNFPVEVAVYALPIIGAVFGLLFSWILTGITRPMEMTGCAMIGAGLGWLLKTAACYPRVSANKRDIRSLVSQELNVSAVNPIPCCIEGTIIGRGVPGLFYSKDLVLHDGTGFLTMQYRQPFGTLEFLFGWLRAGEYTNRKARVYGWYRRAPVPYFEIHRVEMLDSPSGGMNCYAIWGFYFTAALTAICGALLVWLASGLRF